MKHWKKVHHMDTRAVAMADRHYSRQTPGSPEFIAPGHKIVLMNRDDNILWASHRPAPTAGIGRRDGFDYWDNPIFRREDNDSSILASDLILEALAITLYFWGHYPGAIPEDGFHTFIDRKKVKPTIRRGEKIWGYCYLKAGFEAYPQLTKRRQLIRLIMPREKLLLIERVPPLYEFMGDLIVL